MQLNLAKCEMNVSNFFSAPEDPSEKFCIPARELTTACMAHTLCEQKVFQVTQYCSETGSPNMVREFLPFSLENLLSPFIKL